METHGHGQAATDKLVAVLNARVNAHADMSALLHHVIPAINHDQATYTAQLHTTTTPAPPAVTVTYVDKEKIVGAPWALFISVACRNIGLWFEVGSNIIACVCDHVSSTARGRVACGSSGSPWARCSRPSSMDFGAAVATPRLDS